jgi:hypothetical protein
MPACLTSWVDAFASARNAGLARATGDYAFGLGADDVIGPRAIVKTERLFAQVSAELGPQTGRDAPRACYERSRAARGERDDWDAALGYLERSLARSAPIDSITRDVYALIAHAHQSGSS